MIRRILLAVLLLASAFRAEAGFYTDIWYKVVESGWGANLVQTDDFIFVTFFIYGPDGKPTWYSAELRRDGPTRYAGDVYATTGTFFGVPWKAANKTEAIVGTASFTPSTANAYEGTLAYNVTGVGSASNLVERQTLTPPVLGGFYAGGQAGSYQGCTDPAGNYVYRDHYDLTVTHDVTKGTVTLQFDSLGGYTCTLSGKLVQNGQLYRVPTATYKCTGGYELDTTATLSEIKQTSQGIEGRLFAPNAGAAGCSETASFSGALR